MARRFAEMILEYGDEISRRLETRLLGDVSYGKVGLLHQFARPLHPHCLYQFHRRLAGKSLQLQMQVASGHTCVTCQCLHRKILIANVFLNACQYG